MSILEKILV